MRDIPNVSQFQVNQNSIGDITLEYTSDLNSGMENEQRDLIRKRLAKINPELAFINIKKVDFISKTIAGKTKFVRSELVQ